MTRRCAHPSTYAGCETKEERRGCVSQQGDAGRGDEHRVGTAVRSGAHRRHVRDRVDRVRRHLADRPVVPPPRGSGACRGEHSRAWRAPGRRARRLARAVAAVAHPG
ncbi:hypothetical protein FE697_021490 [Mumia zhuanghuii]|uniref:Uncharacterized protein n=1 Tax=Mumia zhuanghuii TaxID=2585211 RepID=A0A5Q6RJY1_9ACTN|nr:hypothetical protein FE697_021490 [Mumia zhuanghuii]